MENLTLVLQTCPALVLWTVAIVIALVRWQHHPVVSALMLVSSVMEILLRLFYAVLPRVLLSRGMETSKLTLIYAVVGFFGLIPTGLIIAAVFLERGPKTARQVDPKLL